MENFQFADIIALIQHLVKHVLGFLEKMLFCLFVCFQFVSSGLAWISSSES